MLTTRRSLSAVFALAATTITLSGSAAAQSVSSGSEKIDYATLARIKEEGLQRSQVMDQISWIADVYGPRLTGGPGIRQAADWTKKKFGEWGLAGIHEEPWAFGKGWQLVRFHAHMIEPQIMPIIGLPKSWTPSTNGTVQADVVLAPIDTAADFDKYKGKLQGKIVLTQPARAVRMLDGRVVLRMNEDDIAEAMTTPVPAGSRAGGGGPGGQGGQGQQLAQRIAQFYQSEGAIAVIERGSDSDQSAGGSDLAWQAQRVDGGTIFVGSGGTRDENAGKGLPSVLIAVEHYNRMVRILEKGVPVKMELHVETKFLDEPQGQGGFNIVAEIPGTDPKLKDEVVILGAHFDSHHGATGATDNATGSVAMIEAMRILKAAGVKPRRTIRVALWGGEEQGLMGSRAYVKQHFADPGDHADQARVGQARGVLQPRQRHRQDPRRVVPGQPRRQAGVRAVDRAAQGPRRRDPRSRARSGRPIMHRSRRWGCRAFSSCRSVSSTTRARTTRTWTSWIACSARTSCSRRRCRRRSRSWPRSAMRSCRGRRSRKSKWRSSGRWSRA